MHKKIFLLILIDQITKLGFWSRDFFLGPVHIHSVRNSGLALSLDFGLLPNLIVIIAALVFFIYYYFRHHSEWGWATVMMFALIFAGAISNLGDRLYLGYVRDFIDLGWGFTFNLADLWLAFGLVGLLFLQSDSKQDII
ncbi:MAG: hypothetical protein A3J07_01220 [Candidatus Doudnabacteria bacterium RIFCSPLOWO2_02_FULL_49_13]|uniref:Lipoprotein signal peptidase n=1 Tax=Candidatus Doudnabacteria bacterium RIFCSPHIGHO2_12_FULL_48_16 TaxID=1817838 RepID=A0A1F5PKY3_9BACT|nr:MAG: hypothetical protein A3B77_04150 [Candidatus Doudnabacteria bacterium RIFCSPHIGHO2_02_FULL_49_24]OGE88675.1 MAG: hypothetical protein A2760_01810 [Candidatus Doudnabacteria bacterium RIFCSPHIGHO2_01_FULL_50_67]OGE90360.1 MAG: hypothetical protein A3E29_04730 [Candidatus Doudnabacteria bacterium RIFCSPHIGHO2_12_FULL_48_16]OGE97067.1 MAG: hypothetical protein A2990_01720 [Candidatus Doudnabacteria bacterium RIFCSPLOWO2_01_FULL_49_40]OGF02416.1 MAG: hypothetical protein A3J07_01220 [Candid